MTTTYEPISTQSLSGSATISFTSVPSTYTDLVLVFTGTTGGGLILVQYNGDTGSNYSSTLLAGTGSSVVSARYSTAYTFVHPGPGSTINTTRLNVFNYTNTNAFKTSVSRADYTGSGGSITAGVQLWRSTSAINQIDLKTTGVGTFTGSVTLYGVKAE